MDFTAETRRCGGRRANRTFLFSAPPRLRGGLVFAFLCALLSARGAEGRCLGDCDRDNEVRVHEILAQVGILLGRTPVAACPTVPGDFGEAIEVADLIGAVTGALTGCPSLAFPALVESVPSAGGVVARSDWPQLVFSAPPDARDLPVVGLRCGDASIALTPALLPRDTGALVALNPAGDLPAAAACRLTWPGGALDFRVAAAGARAEVRYDRTDRRRLTPLPDDFYRAEAVEASADSGQLQIPVPEGPVDLQQIFGGLLNGEAQFLDGFSPLAPWVIELSDAPDRATLPLTPTASLEPLATVQLYDVTPGAATYGQRVPFRLEPRTDASVTDVVTHTLLLFPSIPLAQHHQYGLLITRRALVDATRPFEMSAALAACLDDAGPDPFEAACDGVRRRVEVVLGAVAGTGEHAPALDDVALVVRATIRSTDSIARDQLAVREQVTAAPPPAYEITSVEPGAGGQVAAIVRGTWQAPDWRDANNEFVRDAEGAPVQARTKAVPFTLALPEAALAAPAPIVMYQHGNPGSSEAEVPSAARRSLAAEGFAVVGFTDILNRELSAGITDRDQAILAQVAPVLAGILARNKVPDFWAETRAEQLAFLRLIDGLGGLDVLPLGAPDGVPELDLTLPRGYLGISEGANNGPGLLAYAPEIRAAALVAGGARLTEVLIHQAADTFLTVLGAIYPSLTPTEIWTGLSLFQLLYDNQDAHNHAPFVYRAPVVVGGTTRKASVLLLEGLNDSLVPNHATDSLAWSLGLPHLEPVQRRVPFLDVLTGPLQGNLDAETSGAFYQYVPTGIDGIDPTPGCAALPPSSGSEGHYCPQSAAESFRQRAVFFTSALSGVPRIIDPLAE